MGAIDYNQVLFEFTVNLWGTILICLGMQTMK